MARKDRVSHAGWSSAHQLDAQQDRSHYIVQGIFTTSSEVAKIKAAVGKKIVTGFCIPCNRGDLLATKKGSHG